VKCHNVLLLYILCKFKKSKKFFNVGSNNKARSVQYICYFAEGLWQEFFFFLVRLNRNYDFSTDKDGSYSWNRQRSHWFDLKKKDVLWFGILIADGICISARGIIS
jgi:hypothetical protein